MIRMLILVASGMLLTACHHENTKLYNSDLTNCPEERPQICTREYNPVCATLNDDSHKTYSTGCISCSDEKVTAYKFGKC